MSEQGELWTLTPKGEAAIAQGEGHADPDALDYWVGVGWDLARKVQLFSTNDLYEAADRPEMFLLEPRAMGTVMRRLKRAGIITASGDYEPDRTPGSHGRPKRVWRSLIYRGDGAHFSRDEKGFWRAGGQS
jgi:hypothetical protein